MGCIVTNIEIDSRAVVRFYDKRGTVEQWIKEGKQAVKMTRLSCHRFRPNQVRLWLSLMAYNLGTDGRLVLPNRPAKPRDILSLYGTGFGPTSPPANAVIFR